MQTIALDEILMWHIPHQTYLTQCERSISSTPGPLLVSATGARSRLRADGGSPHALEHVAEQAELAIGVGGGRLCARPIEHDAGLSCESERVLISGRKRSGPRCGGRSATPAGQGPQIQTEVLPKPAFAASTPIEQQCRRFAAPELAS